MQYGKKIAQLRKSRNMTQEELRKVLSVTYQAVSKWERDESMPDFEMMSRIAKFFNVPLNYFAEDEGDEKAVTADAVEAPSTPAPPPPPPPVGMCTHCGKMLTEEEVAQKEPKILCKPCKERLKRESDAKVAAYEERARQRKEKEIYEQRGHGVNITLVLSSIIALVCYIVLTVVYFGTADEEVSLGAAAILFFVPLAVFGAVQASGTFFKEIKDDLTDNFSLDDGPEGYTRNISLITAGAFAVINIVCFLVLYFSSWDTIYLIFLALSVVVSFTFVSQYMWGGIVRQVFTAGGFTFKLPGFIFTLEIESIIWMLVVKFLLGLLSIIVFILTTILVAAVAMFVSVVTFIPSVIHKSVKDKEVENS